MRRKKLLNDLEKSILNNNWDKSIEATFKILYGLPRNIQVDLSCFVTWRYLNIFNQRHPETEWPKIFLDYLQKDISNFEFNIPEEISELNLADSAFMNCFFSLSNAITYKEYQGIFTTSCVCAIYSGINAQRNNAWIEDDPKGVIKWDKREYPFPTVLENKAAIEVARKEWEEVKSWLEKKEIWKQSDNIDFRKMEKVFSYWQEGELMLIVPETRIVLDKKKNEAAIKIQDIL